MTFLYDSDNFMKLQQLKVLCQAITERNNGLKTESCEYIKQN